MEEDKKKEMTNNETQQNVEVNKNESPKTVNGHSNGNNQGKKMPFKDQKSLQQRRKERRMGGGSEFEKRVLTVRRVVRVVAGGRRFSFSAVIAIGDKNGSIGVGVGKSSDTTVAIDKAYNDAKKKMIKLNLTKDGGISHEVDAKFCASVVNMFPSTKGLVAGGVIRTIAELAGIKNLNAKILSRSKSKLNNARATLLALSKLKK